MPEESKKTAKTKDKTAPKTVVETKKGGGIANAVNGVFVKIQKKTGLSDAKLDKFQKDWLNLPENRKKYENLIDAPQVVGEELVAISNDIINFVQGQEGRQSAIFSKLSEFRKEMAKDPVSFLKSAGKKGTQTVMGIAKKAADKAAETLAKPKNTKKAK